MKHFLQAQDVLKKINKQENLLQRMRQTLLGEIFLHFSNYILRPTIYFHKNN